MAEFHAKGSSTLAHGSEACSKAKHSGEWSLGMYYLGYYLCLCAMDKSAALRNKAHNLSDEFLWSQNIDFHNGFEQNGICCSTCGIIGHIGAGLEGKGSGAKLVIFDIDE